LKDPNAPTTIGVLTADLDTAYSQPVIAGVLESARTAGVRLAFLTGHFPGASDEFERQFNLVYRLSDAARCDGLLLIAATLQFHLTPEPLQRFFSTLPKVPAVSLGFASPHLPSVVIDNYGGFLSLMRHVLGVHGCRRVAMIAGPRGHYEGDERLRAWRDAHREFGMEPDESLVAWGNFTQPGGRAAMQDLLRRVGRFDALVTANDETALGAMSVALDHGLRVPDELIIVGFDDILAASRIGVALTTVNQPLRELGSVATGKLIDLIGGKEIPALTRVSTRLVVRQSCGCAARGAGSNLVTDAAIDAAMADLALAPESEPIYRRAFMDFVQSFDDALHQGEIQPFLACLHRVAADTMRREGHLNPVQAMVLALQRRVLETRRLDAAQWPQVARWLQQAQIELAVRLDLDRHNRQRESLEHSMAFRELLKARIATFDLQKLLLVLDEALPRLRVETCCILLYEGEGRINDLYDWYLPERAQLLYAFINGEKRGELAGEVLDTGELLPEAAWRLIGDTAALAVYPVFHGTEHFGLILFGVTPMTNSPWEQIRDEVSSALKASLIVSELQAARDMLSSDLSRAEEGNRALSKLAHLDELTGLLNRRGFMLEAQARADMLQRDGQPYAVFFADMDGLKPINDQLGHAAGDEAIRRSAAVLRHGFRASDSIGRIGGDEFAIFTANADAEALEMMRQRVYKLFEQAADGLPYKLGCSLGFVIAGTENPERLESLLSRADAVLYEEKRRRKGAVPVR